MDRDRFDTVVRSLIAGSSRRSALSLALGAVLTSLDLVGADATMLGKMCRRKCGRCKRCRNGVCTAKRNDTPCGGGKVCRNGRCRCLTACCANADCASGETCVRGECVVCQEECCATADCPRGQTCCLNENRCRDLRNDAAHCGRCQNAQCPGGAICGNGECGLTCTTVGESCFDSDCVCGSRADPAHSGQTICATVSPATCENAATCSDDADCAPGTLGFGQVCVGGLCPPFNVCADPCA